MKEEAQVPTARDLGSCFCVATQQKLSVSPCKQFPQPPVPTSGVCYQAVFQESHVRFLCFRGHIRLAGLTLTE